MVKWSVCTCRKSISAVVAVLHLQNILCGYGLLVKNLLRHKNPKLQTPTPKPPGQHFYLLPQNNSSLVLSILFFYSNYYYKLKAYHHETNAYPPATDSNDSYGWPTSFCTAKFLDNCIGKHYQRNGQRPQDHSQPLPACVVRR